MSNYLKKKALCDENIQSLTDFRKWSLRNHPDKLDTASTAPLRRFQTISGYVTDLLKTREDRIDCPETPKPKSPSAPKPKSPSAPKPKSPSPAVKPDKRKADCLRTTENWSKITRQHRFDKPTFNKMQFNVDMGAASSKMIELIANIKTLDQKDMQREGKRFKHFIFSDVKKGGYGAKIIASALVANGFNHCFTNKLKVKVPTPNERAETFGIMSSTAMFDKSFTQKHVKSVQEMYNERPGNIHGEKMRFIILDSGFKEGIDLYDVKYVHIFENQRNAADLTQAVGRATRSCGQVGLNFVKNVGWQLHVYQYTLMKEDGVTPVFNDFLQYSGVNLNKVKMTENLEKMAILTAVDYDLNRNVNESNIEFEDDVLELAYPDLFSGGAKRSVGCASKDKCGTRSTKTVPFTLKDMQKAYTGKLPTNFTKMLTKDKRAFFCIKLRTNQDFCDKMNRLYFGSPSATKQQQQLALRADSKRPSPASAATPSMKEYFLDMKQDVEDMEDLPFDQFMKRINKMFGEYKYKPIVVKNGCAKQPGASKEGADDRLVTYSESQEFVTRYFTPAHFAKGLLVWHSVGTGKTCTAISVKSFLFERMDYSVLWVTRTTLKEDIWKNMYDKICDHIIREKYTKGDDRKKLRKYMSKRFLPPMSYKQFSNTLEGKNDIYKKLVEMNGEADILKNTLIVVDEAHKLYSNADMLAAEKPNMAVIEDKIRDSKSCKVMLMTGTPVTEDPMSFVRLLNLTMKGEQFPVEYDAFVKEYMSGANEFTKAGKRKFQEKAKGLISYLNKRYDPRQFAQPVFHPVNVPMTVHEPEFKMEECLAPARAELAACQRPEPSDPELEELTKDKALLESDIQDTTDRLKNDKLNAVLKDRLKTQKAALKVLKANIRTRKAAFTRSHKAWKANDKKCTSAFKKQEKTCKKEVDKQKEMYQNIALKKC